MTDETPRVEPLDLIDTAAAQYLALAAFTKARHEGKTSAEAVRAALGAATRAALIQWNAINKRTVQ